MPIKCTVKFKVYILGGEHHIHKESAAYARVALVQSVLMTKQLLSL